MNIKEQKFGDITALTLGETDVGDNVDSELKESIRRFVSTDSASRIVEDLADVKWMTSSAFGILAAAQGSLRPNGDGIHLARPKHRVVSAFNIMPTGKTLQQIRLCEAAVQGFDS